MKISKLIIIALSMLLASSAFADSRPRISTTSCCCNTSIVGTYTFFIDPAGAPGSTGPFTATFSTSGCTFRTIAATSNGYQIYGTITGNQVNLSQVVDGEEAEGYVLQVKGFARKTAFGANIIAGTYQDTNGVVGSWTASKAP